MNIDFSEYQGDFNSMTDDEVDWELKISLETISEHESWVEAVMAWKAAGKPRFNK